jgi:hypothetical protein
VVVVDGRDGAALEAAATGQTPRGVTRLMATADRRFQRAGVGPREK